MLSILGKRAVNNIRVSALFWLFRFYAFVRHQFFPLSEQLRHLIPKRAKTWQWKSNLNWNLAIICQPLEEALPLIVCASHVITVLRSARNNRLGMHWKMVAWFNSDLPNMDASQTYRYRQVQYVFDADSPWSGPAKVRFLFVCCLGLAMAISIWWLSSSLY